MGINDALSGVLMEEGYAGVFKRPIALESLLAAIGEHCGPPA